MEKQLIKLVDRTFHTTRTFSAQATWQESPWLRLFSSPGIPENSLSCQHQNDHSSFYCTGNLPISVWLSFGLVNRAIDTPRLVRKGYLLPLSFLGFNDGLFPTGTGICWLEPRRPCIPSRQELVLPWVGNWHTVGTWRMWVNCRILSVTWRCYRA